MEVPMNSFKNKSNLEKYYRIFLEVGLIISLLIFLGLTKIPLNNTGDQKLTLNKQEEIVQMEEVERTKQKERPPAPPRPTSPVEVPNDEIIEDEVLNIDAEVDLKEQLELPPAPPSTGEEEGQEPEEDFFVAVEEMPELIGGLKSIQEKIKYPQQARAAGIEGRVIVQFIVNAKGEVENPRIIRGIGGGCDKEALRVIKHAKFEPGLQRGKAVRVQYSLPIVFMLKE